MEMIRLDALRGREYRGSRDDDRMLALRRLALVEDGEEEGEGIDLRYLVERLRSPLEALVTRWSLHEVDMESDTKALSNQSGVGHSRRVASLLFAAVTNI